MQTKSKFNFWQVYFLLIFFGGVLVIGFYYIFHSEITLHTKFGTDMSAGYAGLLMTALCVYFLYYAIKNFKFIIVNADGIIIKSLLKEINITKGKLKEIDLFARKDLGFMSSSKNVNGINITTNECEFFFIPDLYYRNSPEIKFAIQNDFASFILKSELQKNNIRRTASIITDQEFEKFSGNFLLSLNGIIFICISVFMLFFMFNLSNTHSPALKLIFLYPTLLFYFVFGYQANYFLLSSNELIIKNQLWWWRKIRYNLDDIDDVIIENFPKQSNALRINTKNYKSKKYPAGSLHNKTWKKMLEKFASMDIKNNSEVFI